MNKAIWRTWHTELFSTDDERSSHPRHTQWLVRLLLILFFFRCFTSMVRESSTWDETHYLGIGKYLLQHFSWDVPGSILHPPLSFMIHDLPLLFVPTDESVWRYSAGAHNDPNFLLSADPARGRQLLSSPLNARDQILTLTRLTNVFLAVLLMIYIYRWAGDLYGRRGGVLALGLATFCPNLLAHARYITPDLPLTAFSFIFFFYLRRLMRTRSRGDSAKAGLFLGCAILSKYTAILLLPLSLLPLLSVMSCLRSRFSGTVALSARKPLVSALLVMWGTAILLFFLFYRFNPTPYFKGIQFQVAHASGGHSAFLVGKYSIQGWWYYYLVTFLVKTPVAVLVLLGIVCAATRRRPSAGGSGRTREWMLAPFPVMVFALFSVQHQALGYRYILPILPFLYVYLGRLTFLRSCRARALAVAALLYYAGTSLAIHPHYLAYFNELAGGPKNGYKVLVDSNLDWGQDLKGLGAYADRMGIRDLTLVYFGTDTPARYGIPVGRFYNLYSGLEPPLEFPPETTGVFAISATELQGVYNENHHVFDWLKGKTPVARIGYSIFVYRLGGT
jgi:4-amino-4-deoxy-L-arabinose transferase-like glycosyltransferase